MRSRLLSPACLPLLLLNAWVSLGQPVTFNFDNGQLPADTIFTGNQAGTGITNAGGFNNSGCLVLTRPGTGAQDYGQWLITNDLAGGVPVTAFNISFKLYMGHGSGGNAGVPNTGGNGLVLHLGPTPPSQYTGSASSWGNGLDVTFRSFNNSPNTSGLNVAFNTVTGLNATNFNPGGGTIIARNSFLGFFQTNGAGDNFSEAVDVQLNLANDALTVVCSNSLIGNVVVYTNVAIPGFTNISPGLIAFTASEGAGAHEDAWIDNVSVNLNPSQSTGPAGFSSQPLSVTTNENVYVTFNVGVTGAPPVTIQWMSNDMAIAGATAAAYTTPLTTHAMSGTTYSVAITNSLGWAISSNAILTVTQSPVVITVPPANQTVFAGSAATFTVTLDPSSSGPLAYQWWRVAEGVSTNPISSATASTYTTPALTTNDSGGRFFVVVTGALSTATSSVAVVTVVPQGGPGQPTVFSFDDGQVPPGTTIRGNNPALGITNAGGFNGTGCLILTRPASGQTYGQWVVTNDLAFGMPVNSFNISFKLYMGHGSGGNAGVPNAGGNGLVFHLGPVPPNQQVGSDSSWGNGLDVSFRTYGNSQNSVGLNLEYNSVTNNFNAAGTGNVVAYTGFFGYFQTNGAADNFSEAVDVWMSLSNGRFNLACSNALIGYRVIYSNYDIPAFVPVSPGCIAFTATDGAGAHEDAWIDSVSINLNSYQPSGPVVYIAQPANQISHAGEPVTFTVSATGTSPFSFQWNSNNVPIPGATAASYSTPPVVTSMSGTVYSVMVSNVFGALISSNANLRVLPALPRNLVWNDEFSGTLIDGTKWFREGDVSRQQGYWIKEDAYLNGQGQLVLRVLQDPVTGNYGSGALHGTDLRTFGYFEAKVKFPTQQGHWCAFWVYSDSEGSTNIIGGGDGAEMDVMEKAWLTDHLQHALHWDGYSPSPLAGSAGIQVTNKGLNDGGWHIFAMDWTPTNYTFYVDGTLTWSTNAGGVCQVPCYIRLSEEIGYFGTPGPNTWGTGPITNAILPDYYLVDYVRVFDTNVFAQFAPPALLGSTNLVLTWTGGGTLLTANNLAGPWSVVTNASSPFTNVISPNIPQAFFRVQQ